jgi:hypothetical protein
MKSLGRLLRISLFFSSLSLAAIASQTSFEAEARAASSKKPKVAIGGFSGDKKGEARDAFIAALRSDGSYEITDAEDVKSTSNAKAIAEAAKAMEVSVVITGKLNGVASLKLKLLDANGKLLDDAEIKGGTRAKLKANIQRNAASSVEDGVDKANVKAQAEASDDDAEHTETSKAQAEAKAEVESDDDDTGGGLSPFDLTAGLRAMRRTFTFNDMIADVRPNQGFARFLKYRLPLGPAAFVDLDWYPGAHFAKGQAERIGITAGYEKGFAISTVYNPDGGPKQTLKTNEQAFYVGARYRLPLAAHELGAALTFGQHTFALDGDDAAPLVPDVKYTYVKLGLDGTLRIGPVSVGARVGKRFVFSTGALGDVWFPGSVKTQSLEAGATLGYRLVGPLEVVAGFDWLRYAFDFNGAPQRAGFESAVAGGAVDNYYSGFLGLRVHWPTDAESAPAAAASPAPHPTDPDDE